MASPGRERDDECTGSRSGERPRSGLQDGRKILIVAGPLVGIMLISLVAYGAFGLLTQWLSEKPVQWYDTSGNEF